jgi:hypothetical protein
MVNTEGGTDDEEFRVAALVDRVNTTFDVWMGSTLGCAQCHTPTNMIRSRKQNTTRSSPF